MKSKERLVLLADKLDRKGLLREASVIDEVIIKKSFDEETRGDVNSVLNMTLQLLDELDSAVRVGVAGLESEPGSGVFIKGFSGAIKGESLKAYYQDKYSDSERLQNTSRSLPCLRLKTKFQATMALLHKKILTCTAGEMMKGVLKGASLTHPGGSFGRIQAIKKVILPVRMSDLT